MAPHANAKRMFLLKCSVKGVMGVFGSCMQLTFSKKRHCKNIYIYIKMVLFGFKIGVMSASGLLKTVRLPTIVVG